MADKDDFKAKVSAEKAFAAAASGSVKPAAKKVAAAKPKVTKPSVKSAAARPKVTKPSAKPVKASGAAVVAKTIEPAKAANHVEPEVIKAADARIADPVPAPAAQAVPAKVQPEAAASVEVPADVVSPEPVAAPKVVSAPKVVATATPKTEPKAESPKVEEKASAKVETAHPSSFPFFTSVFIAKDQTMDMNANFGGFQDAISEAQAKAKAAFEKSTSLFGEVTDFTKGNVEAMIESGKILADGVQDFGSTLAAEGRSSFEAISGDMKELAAAKSPTDFLKLQGDLLRKNFDTAVAHSSKHSEAMLKLVSDAMAPISGRVSIAVEKARKAASI